MSHSNADIRVFERGQIRILQIGRIQQSSMYLDAPFDTDFDYPGYLHLTVALAPHARRGLMIGLGGGTVAKRMWRDYPRLALDVVESDPDIIRIACDQFAVPQDDRLRLHAGDGRAFLTASEDTYDILIVDAFDDERVPFSLITEQFCHLALGHLAEGGVLAYNFHGSVTGTRSKPFRRMYRTLRETFARVWVFPVGISRHGEPGDHREIIMLATDAALSADDLRERIASRVGGLVTVPEFHEYGGDLYEQPIRSGDVRPYRDGEG